jgi:hypothetical protein
MLMWTILVWTLVVAAFIHQCARAARKNNAGAGQQKRKAQTGKSKNLEH